MKKFKIFSLLATILLCSFFVYSCMKEVPTQLPALETLQAQSNSTTNDIKKEALNKLFTQGLNHVSADEPLSSMDNECSVPSDAQGCETYDFTFPDNVTIDMPPTTLNPLQTVAILRFTMTVCFGSNGQVTISYRNVEASNKDFFPVDALLNYWLTLSSPKLEEAIDEYTRLASNKMEDMMTKDFFIKNPKTTILESRYFKGLCYTTCIFKDKDGTLKSATTSCGDRCCKRLKIWKNNPKTGPVLIQETFDVEGSPTCLGKSQPPCENAIKVTEICSHECNPRLVDEEKQ